MIYLKLRQDGLWANHKRLDRLYVLEKLHVRRRQRRKVPTTDRQPLIRLSAANEVWSIDFIFDRIASGRVFKCLVIVDNTPRTRGRRDGPAQHRRPLAHANAGRSLRAA